MLLKLPEIAIIFWEYQIDVEKKVRICELILRNLARKLM